MAVGDTNTSDTSYSSRAFFSIAQDDAMTLESLFSAIIKFDGDSKGDGDVLMLAHLGKKMAGELVNRIDSFSTSFHKEACHG